MCEKPITLSNIRGYTDTMDYIASFDHSLKFTFKNDEGNALIYSINRRDKNRGILFPHININVKQIQEIHEKSGVPFDQVLSEIIAHEVLHYVLLTEVSEKACDDLDKITYGHELPLHLVVKKMFGGFIGVKRPYCYTVNISEQLKQMLQET